MRKKKILVHGDFSLAKTGFGRNNRLLLSYLYKTGKYDLVNYCCGAPWSSPDLKRTPWKSLGSIPDDQNEINAFLSQFQADNGHRESEARKLGYGDYYLNRAIEQERPDVYFGVQDFWGVDFAIDKQWWDKITSVIWTTLDSLPLIQSAIDKASKIKNYWIWSDFATKEMHRLGHTHVKTIHGILDEKEYSPLSDENKANQRAAFGIEQDAFIIGFVFRNQLRKSVPNLINGYKLWKQKHPDKKSYLLLHTHFQEGWNIPQLCKRYSVSEEEILTTYVCRACRAFEVKKFTGHDLKCRFCGCPNGQITTNVSVGVTESQLNKVYNLMDVYCHPFTSGGQEIPIQEAKLAGLITLVTDYSCGEELCQDGSGSIPLNWTTYWEIGTEFEKASTCPVSIAEKIEEVYSMPKEERGNRGKISREWVIKNYSVESVGKIIESFLDSCPLIEHTSNITQPEPKDPNAAIPVIEDNKEWVKTLYKNILKMDVSDEDQGLNDWLKGLEQGRPRQDVESFFRNTAQQEMAKTTRVELSHFLAADDEGRRLIYVMPESIGDVFMSTALFNSIAELYPNHNLYVATKPENFDVLKANPHIFKVIPYTTQMESLLFLEGAGNHKGFFEIAFLPFATTQRFLTYLHNGKDIIAYKDLKE